MWFFGMTSAATGCSNVGFLRGSHELPDSIDRLLKEADAARPRAEAVPKPPSEASSAATPSQAAPASPAMAHPLIRASLIREQARLAAMNHVHRRAFPLSLGQFFLGLMLVLSVTAIFSQKVRWRGFAIQIIAANAALAIATFVVLAPVRAAMADAVAHVLVEQPMTSEEPVDQGEALNLRRRELAATELQLLVAQLAVFGFAALMLTRPRTLAYFATVEAARARASESDES